MKAKQLFKALLAQNILRHRQHHRFLRSMRMHLHQFGPRGGLLMLGMIAMAGRYLQKRRAARTAHLPEVESGY